MQGLHQRVNKLYSHSISDVSSEIIVYKDNKTIKQSFLGTNKNKVIRIVVGL